MSGYYVFIVARSGTARLRTGWTRDPGLWLARTRNERTRERLLYFEHCPDAESACRRERQLRCWNRQRRACLIRSMNPLWCDLRSLW